MYESFYHLSEKPFTLLPDPGFLYLSDKHRMALTLLEYGLMNQAGFTVISGDIGTGKTTLIRHLLDHMDREHTVGLISNTHRDFGELLQWILLAFNLEHAGLNKVEMYQRLVDFIIDEYAHNRHVVIIVDEAQNMAPETLEELRMLSNINADKDQALQVILVGQKELRDTLRRPDLVQFAQRISVDYHLEPLSGDEVIGYIRHRMEVAGGDPDTFTEAACLAVHRFSGGVPRLINLLCDTALVYGFAEQREHIDSVLVTDVAREKQQGGIFPVYAEPGPPEPRKPAPSAEKPTVAEAPATTSEPESEHKPAETSRPTPANPVPGMPTATGRPTIIATRSPQATQKLEQPKPVPAIKPVSSPETVESKAANKKLRIALCSVKEGLLDYLSRLLESHSHEVVSSGPLSIGQLDTLNPDDIDVLVITINEDNTYVPAPLKKRLRKWPGLVYYSDSTAAALSLHHGDPEFGRLLSERLLEITEDTLKRKGAVS